MAQPSLAAATEACPDPDEPSVVLQLERSSTAKSRYKGVTKVNEKIWQARVMVDGKLQHVRSSRKPRDCAIALAQFKRACMGGAGEADTGNGGRRRKASRS